MHRTATQNLVAGALLIGLMASPAHAEDLDIYQYGDQLLTTEVGPNKAPRGGQIRLLVVPVSFGAGEDFSEILPFFDPDPAAGYTFSNFWRAQSAGRLQIDTFIMDTVAFDGCPVAGNPSCQFDPDNATEAIPLAEAIFERILAELPRPLSDFDLGGPGGHPDGWVDGVMLLLPSYNGGIAPPVWPFVDVIKDGVQVGYAAISRLDRETILHEFGHNLGACDQYLWDFEHSLMSWCDHCSLDVHTRTKLGWTEVVEVEPDTDVIAALLPSVGAEGAEVGPALRVGGRDEYYLIERRAPYHVGDKLVDPGLDGVLVVHVDERVTPPVLAQSDYPLHHALLEVEHAPSEPSRSVLDTGDILEPADDHAPTTPARAYHDTNWYDGARSGIRVQIGERSVDEGGRAVIGVSARGVSGAEAELTTIVDLTQPPDPEDPTPDLEDPTPDPEDPTPDPVDPTPDPTSNPSVTHGGESGGCAGGGGSPAPAWWMLLLALTLVLPRRGPARSELLNNVSRRYSETLPSRSPRISADLTPR